MSELQMFRKKYICYKQSNKLATCKRGFNDTVKLHMVEYNPDSFRENVGMTCTGNVFGNNYIITKMDDKNYRCMESKPDSDWFKYYFTWFKE